MRIECGQGVFDEQYARRFASAIERAKQPLYDAIALAEEFGQTSIRMEVDNANIHIKIHEPSGTTETEGTGPE